MPLSLRQRARATIAQSVLAFWRVPISLCVDLRDDDTLHADAMVWHKLPASIPRLPPATRTARHVPRRDDRWAPLIRCPDAVPRLGPRDLL